MSVIMHKDSTLNDTYTHTQNIYRYIHTYMHIYKAKRFITLGITNISTKA